MCIFSCPTAFPMCLFFATVHFLSFRSIDNFSVQLSLNHLLQLNLLQACRVPPLQCGLFAYASCGSILQSTGAALTP